MGRESERKRDYMERRNGISSVRWLNCLAVGNADLSSIVEFNLFRDFSPVNR